MNSILSGERAAPASPTRRRLCPASSSSRSRSGSDDAALPPNFANKWDAVLEPLIALVAAFARAADALAEASNHAAVHEADLYAFDPADAWAATAAAP